MIVEEIRLILADLETNSNKVWRATLEDNEDVTTYWGRVSDLEQSKKFPRAGKVFLEKKRREKERKGYRELQTLKEGSTINATDLAADTLEALAVSQIKTSRPELKALIGRLVKSNIHRITSNTNIQYNVSSGLFTTPLGIVTSTGIAQARDLLAEIKKEKSKNDLAASTVNQYLMLIPQDFGRQRVGPNDIFPDADSVQKQLDILDSLEASYQAVQTPSVSATVQEKVFNLELDALMNGESEYDRLVHFFEKSKKKLHGYDDIHVENIYKVNLGAKQYDENLGNVWEVFHGTSEANLLSILKSGFKVRPPSTAYIAGDLFGSGVYGAVSSTKSLGYTYGRWGGSSSESGWLFICDFYMGKMYETSSWGASRPKGYDSIYAKATGSSRLKNDELIVSSERQAKIKYLIECK